MKLNGLLIMAMSGLLTVACSNDDETPDGADAGADAGGGDPNYPMHKCGDADIKSAHCTEIPAGDATALLNATNTLEADTTIVLAQGTYMMTNEVNIQNLAHIHLLGQGKDQTILNWKGTTAQVNGIAALNTNDFLIQDFTVANSIKDGIRVEASDGVTFRRIKATWDTAARTANGAYGIYPVKSAHVLVEDSFAERASDAGLYVGQCQNVIVRNNEVTGNVAGLEIENTEYADVYGNNVYGNTGGLVIFDLPGNPIIGRDIKVHDNHVHDNNGVNFAAPGGTVNSVPVGTGTFAMASRRVEISNNKYENNNTGDIAIVSGLVIQSDQSKWNLTPGMINGNYTDLNLLPGFNADGSPDTTKLSNFRSEQIQISGNTHSGSGTNPDLNNPLQVGLLLKLLYGSDPVSNVIYDTIGETDLTTNDNNICAGGQPENSSFASLNFAEQDEKGPGQPVKIFPAHPFDSATPPVVGGQFDCVTPPSLAANPVVLWNGM
ncbi:MAG: parallel beta-helix domain-containing protein [Myxococcales bacterium]